VKPLRLDSAAREELLHEVRYYEAARPGSGRKFREAVDAAFDLIRRTPTAGRPEVEDCRRWRVKGFPFSIVYREQHEEIVVFAIKADAREPGYWQSRAN
jgi:plasmid stabilization system protein ParE